MNERRRFERVRMVHYLRVAERESGSYAGSAIEISEGGLRLVSDRSWEKERTVRFRMQLPAGGYLGTHVDIDAVCRWCNQNRDEPGTYESGFEFTGQVDTGISVIKNLIADLKANRYLDP